MKCRRPRRLNTEARIVFYTLKIVEADTYMSGLSGTVTVGGTAYSAATTLTVQGGTEITVTMRAASGEGTYSYITFDGVQVAKSTSSSKGATYTFALSANTTISMQDDYGDDGSYGIGVITTS